MSSSSPSSSATDHLSPQQRAAKILLERRFLQSRLTDLAKFCGWNPARHHRVIIERLEKVLRGDCDRLIICSPPGSAKSTYVSILFPAWFLCNFPGANIIAASHTSELAERFGRKVRDLIADHSVDLGIALRPDIQAAARWQLTSGGEYLAAGVGSAILGFRADLAIIDDPVRSREDAMSDQIRRSQWDWFQSDLHSRLKPGGKIVIVSTRFAEDDLAGRLLRESEDGTGEKFESLIIPAVAESDDDPIGRKPGELLWGDDSYGYARALKREHATQSPMNWAALYMQRPAPESGDYFKAEWIKPVPALPDKKTMRIYAASDYAVTSKGGDFTCHVICGIDPDWKLYLLDLWRGQTSPDIWIEKMLDMASEYKPIIWGEEAGQIKSSVGPFIDRRMIDRKIPLYRQTFPTPRYHDKAIRAQAIRGHMSLNGLYVDTKKSWFAAFQQELLSFPVGRHDDQVDALGLIGQMLATVMAGQKPKVPKVNFDPPGDYVSVRDAELFDRIRTDADFHAHMGELDPENERLYVSGGVKML
jgi:predicted phage terminase large subunit-like protein